MSGSATPRGAEGAEGAMGPGCARHSPVRHRADDRGMPVPPVRATVAEAFAAFAGGMRARVAADPEAVGTHRHAVPLPVARV